MESFAPKNRLLIAPVCRADQNIFTNDDHTRSRFSPQFNYITNPDLSQSRWGAHGRNVDERETKRGKSATAKMMMMLRARGYK